MVKCQDQESPLNSILQLHGKPHIVMFTLGTFFRECAHHFALAYITSWPWHVFKDSMKVVLGLGPDHEAVVLGLGFGFGFGNF